MVYKAQKKINRYKNDCRILANMSSDHLSKAHIKGGGFGAWLQAIPMFDEPALKPFEFCIATYLCLGLPLPFGHWITMCDYSADIDPHGYHLLNCKKGGGPL